MYISSVDKPHWEPKSQYRDQQDQQWYLLFTTTQKVYFNVIINKINVYRSGAPLNISK